MTSTYEMIATTTLGSATANVTFTSIPATYTDLVLVSTFSVVSNSYTGFQFNSDTGANYSSTNLFGNGTSATSDRLTNDNNIYFGNYSSQKSGRILQSNINIMNYSNTTTYKSSLIRYTDAGEVTSASVGLWRSTAAINSIKIFQTNATNIASGSTFTLYGIKAE
jgi:hypothetical protein